MCAAMKCINDIVPFIVFFRGIKFGYAWKKVMLIKNRIRFIS